MFLGQVGDVGLVLVLGLFAVAFGLDGLAVDLLREFKSKAVNHLLVAMLLCDQCLLQLSEALVALSNFVVQGFDLKAKLVDDAPRNHVLLCQPGPRLRVGCLPEENAEMEQVPKLVALVDIDVNALLFAEPALFVLDVGVDGANKLAVTTLGTVLAACGVSQFVRQVRDAAVQQQLDVPGQLRKLLNDQVLLAHKLLKARVVNSGKVQVCWVGLVVKRKVDAIRLLFMRHFVVVGLLLLAGLVGVLDFKPKPLLCLGVELAPIERG